jgi:succinate-semialdehyde dehydrogenase/glutarate-semialdehyde dehydrogenase
MASSIESAAPPIHGHFIAGSWESAVAERTFPARNPATGDVLAVLAEGNRDDARRAIAAANRAREQFRQVPIWERAALCRRIAHVMERRADHLARVERRADHLARVLAAEQGKPLEREARAEVPVAIQGLAEASEHIKWLEGAVISAQDPHKRVHTFYQPRGGMRSSRRHAGPFPTSAASAKLCRL